MNTPWLLLALGLSSGALAALAQTTPGPATDAADSSAYRVTERGPHSRVWSRVVWEPGPAGDPVRLVRTYTELQAGAHYWADGQWRESEERIESCPGGAKAVTGQHRVFFPNNLAGPATLRLETPDGKILRSRILGLSYFDESTGSSVLISEIQDCQGVIVEPNQVIYENAFTDFNAAVRFTYTKSGFEQDIILLERPSRLPEDYQLNLASSRLQVWSELVEAPEVVLVPGSAEPGPEARPDPLIRMGAGHIGRGRAFSLGEGPQGRGIGVSKQWIQVEGRQFLVEEIPVP